jgi:transcriptional regulator PpsR
LDAEQAATLLSAASDITLLLDRRGFIRDLAIQSEDLARILASGAPASRPHDGWIGRAWADTVTIESRLKVAALVADAASGAGSRPRHVNLPIEGGPDVPVLFSTVRVDPDRIVAFGRDLRTLSDLQQRLVEAQLAMERDYARLRAAETRYRALFRIAPDAMLVLDAATLRVIDANPASRALLGEGRRGAPRDLLESLDSASLGVLESMAATLRATGRAEPVSLRLLDGELVTLSAVSLRHEDGNLLLARLSPHAVGEASLRPTRAGLLALAESAPDGFVVTDTEGRVVAANHAFLDMVQVASEDQAVGESLERWLGRPGVDLGVLLGNLRQHGSVRLFATSLLDTFASSADVEISAVAIPGSAPQRLGFIVRNVARRLTTEPAAARVLPRSVDQLTELIGRVSLKELVREATDVIERLCIEAALDQTGDNRASAAEILGLSRQSLYVKLRRYGLGDLASESAD